MALRRLMNSFNRTRHPLIIQDSRFLDLPLTLILDLFDELPLSDKVSLSQSCKGLWYSLNTKCKLAISKADAQERWVLAATVAERLDNVWACHRCRKLHTVKYRDTPSASFSSRHIPCPEAPLTEDESPRENQISTAGSYSITFHHIHLATKFARLDVNHEYRAKILQKHTAIRYRDFVLSVGSIAEPIVVSGRFLLKITYTCTKNYLPVSISTLKHVRVRICPHTGMYQRASPLFETKLLTAIISAFENPECDSKATSKIYSCEHCPTDYSVTYMQEEMVFQIWQDLGNGNSCSDPYWQSHGWSMRKASLNSRLKFKYEHGSIQNLYQTSIK